MNDEAAKFREQEELNTRNRASMLGLQYFDSRELAPNSRLFPGLLTIQEMYQGHIVPLSDGVEKTPLVVGITINTPQQLLRQLHDRFEERVVQFVVMSNAGYRELMLRYDPPKKTVYDDVKIASEGDSDTIEEVSKTLDS